MKALLVGPETALGRELAALLLGEGFKLTALAPAIEEPWIEELGAEFIPGTLLDEEQVLHAVSGVRAVFNCSPSIPLMRHGSRNRVTVNLKGTGNLLVAMSRAGVEQLVHVGSALAFEPLSGETPLEAGGSIRSAQDAVLRYWRDSKLAAVVVNPALLMGRFDHAGPGALVLRRALQSGGSAPRGGTGVVGARDAAELTLKALGRGKPGRVYTLCARNISYADLFSTARAIASELKIAPEKSRVKSAALDRMLDMELYYEGENAVRELGAAFESIEDTLRDALSSL